MPIPLAGRKLNVSHSQTFPPTKPRTVKLLRLKNKGHRMRDTLLIDHIFAQIPTEMCILPIHMTSQLGTHSAALQLLLGHKELFRGVLGSHQPETIK